MRGVWVQTDRTRCVSGVSIRLPQRLWHVKTARMPFVPGVCYWKSLLMENSVHHAGAAYLETSVRYGVSVRLGSFGALRGLCAPWKLRCDTVGLPHLSNLGAPQKARCTLGSSATPLDHFFIERWSRSAPSFEKCTEVDGTHQKVRRCTEAAKVCRVWRGVSKSERHIDAHWALRLGVEYRG